MPPSRPMPSAQPMPLVRIRAGYSAPQAALARVWLPMMRHAREEDRRDQQQVRHREQGDQADEHDSGGIMPGERPLRS